MDYVSFEKSKMHFFTLYGLIYVRTAFIEPTPPDGSLCITAAKHILKMPKNIHLLDFLTALT